MNIHLLENLSSSSILDLNNEHKFLLFNEDLNKRKIHVYKLLNIKLTGKTLFYPNLLLFSDHSKKIYNPIDEETMSLKKVQQNNVYDYTNKLFNKRYIEPLFFFVYNFDNYYHFLYDTLPYLITYKYLKQKIKNIKLLVNYPNKQKKEFYRFNIEFLELLDIHETDFVFVDKEILYENIYISSSYTHSNLSNNFPRSEVYDLFKQIRDKALQFRRTIDIHDNIYISRRTHLHGNLDNIGTNYTQRRRMLNEDLLVSKLKEINYKEVFTENLTTIEKIHLFYNCKNIIGSIGGGIANVVFSKPSTHLYSIISPGFMKVNLRFKFCIDRVYCHYIYDTSHNEQTIFKKYMRIKDLNTNIIGEIDKVNDDSVIINYQDEILAGWNQTIKYKKKTVLNKDIQKLDEGLNSTYILNIDKLLYCVLSNHFIELSHRFGERFDLVQAGGGNISFKLNNNMYIKASGCHLTDLDIDKNYISVNYINIKNKLDDIICENKKERELLAKKIVDNQIVCFFDNKPSIETTMHTLTKRFTIHIHPIQFIVLSTFKCRQIIEDNFKDVCFIDYFTPGIDLALQIKKIYNNQETIFLKNHGIVITTDNIYNLYHQTELIISKLEQITHLECEKYRYVNIISNSMIEFFNEKFITYYSEDIVINDFLKKDINFRTFFPDKLIYCGIDYIIIKNLAHDIKSYFDIHSEIPKIFIMNNNLYICGSSLKKCRDIESVLKAHILCSNKINKVDYLTNEEIIYLNNWDAEKYRRNI